MPVDSTECSSDTVSNETIDTIDAQQEVTSTNSMT